MSTRKQPAAGQKEEPRSFGALADTPGTKGMTVGPNTPDHVRVAQEEKARIENARAAQSRQARYRELQEKFSGKDASDVMFAPGRSDLLCGVIPDPEWHYVIVTENTALEGKSRPNYARLLGEGYEIAKLPDGSDANWPEISKAIMRCTQAQYQRYRDWVELQVLEASGVGVGLPKATGQSQEGSGEQVIHYRHENEVTAVGAAQLGVPVPTS